MPKSLRWRMVQGRFDEALKIYSGKAPPEPSSDTTDDEMQNLLEKARYGLLAQKPVLKIDSGKSWLYLASDPIPTPRMGL